MIRVLEKKIFYHTLDLGFEQIRIPVRVKFGFEIQNGAVIPDSLSKEMLYNLSLLEKYFPNLDKNRLEKNIEKTINSCIYKYLRASGYLKQD